ncbi:Eco57I restriction-modification methylase domain-containing protein [Paenibacillus sp. N3.4]|uniref:Eco57I restriction-modification methylase domain-containing protein n=1 Tax=Paenibacillus sp. N3.4 TaxID=2603222 RepID=UPI0011CA9937|nr:N-6 DNA methylase [Paenibacillus sp. N3.4]TXK83557.1 N-6 DNA methylase [Paenibacillus sp. N3.4]
MIEKCQVFTPAQIVIELLDAVGYTKDLYGKKVVENACGDGNILKEIVRRYIDDSLCNKKSIDEIKQGLERDVYGAEIDEVHYARCLSNLDEISASFGINNVKWNILNMDFLKQNLKNKFDYVIGNPPYITYRDLDDETRIYLKEHFASCKQGKFDYCYAFIEASLSCLNSYGKLAYLIPNSIFKNVFAQELRNMILPKAIKIIDYTTQKLFEQALTSSAILVCDKGEVSKNIEYQDVANSTSFTIPKTNLDRKWIFADNKLESKPKRRFGDYFSAAISIATLLNKAYLLKEFKEEGDYIIVNNFKIERNVIREGVSPRSLNYKKSELILFPYRYNENTLVRYRSDEFEKNCPEATKYLKSFAKELHERKSDKSIEWFEYGRTQALAHLNQPKLLLSTVVTKEVKVYELSKECIPYSGIYILPKKDFSLAKAKEILESESFYKYVQGIGINANGSSLRITAVDIKNYEF